MAKRNPIQNSIWANLTAGALTILPLLVVLILLSYLFTLLSWFGAPLAYTLTNFIDGQFPPLKPVLTNTFIQGLVGIVFVLAVLFLIGAATSRVLGVQLIVFVEALINRIPLIHNIYRAAKELVAVVHTTPKGASHVVFIDFPHQGAKAIGLVMHTFEDHLSGEELATVFVPTAPNPTVGYLQLAPVSKLMQSDMTLDQAMIMIISGGAVIPDHMSLHADAPATGIVSAQSLQSKS